MARRPVLAAAALALVLAASSVPAHPFPDTVQEEWSEEDACWRYAVPEGIQRDLGLDGGLSPGASAGGPDARPRALLLGAAAQAGYDPARPHELGDASLAEALLTLYGTQDLEVGLADRVRTAAFAADLDPRLRQALAPLIQRLAHAVRDHHAAFGGRYDPGELPDQARLVHAGDGLLGTVGSQRAALAAVPDEAWPDDPVRDPAGVLAVGSPGDDTYREHRFLQVDPAGEDTYRNNAGGGFAYATVDVDELRYQEVALHIDLAGDDRYLPSLELGTNLNVAQGAGQDGVGVMVDWRGNDTYRADLIAQGATFRSGVGVAWDRHGNDSYRAGSEAQGGSYGGQGLLLDEQGDDSHYVDFQGVGWGRDFGTHGTGILADVHGSDTYDGKNSDVVGFGEMGGLGLLADDGEGDDAYVFRENEWAANDRRWSGSEHGVGCDDG